MVETPVGYRFFPTEEELINDYLRNKILGKTWLFEDEISEINICNFEPKVLPSLAKMQFDHLHRPVWYFFSPKEYTSAKKNVTKRTTGSGYWKVTGIDLKIRDKRGNGVEIGIKKTLVYYEGKASQGVRTPWVMHEYHITSLPPNHMSNYVLCQVIYKGEEGDVSYGNHLSESSQSLLTDPKKFGGINTPSEESVVGYRFSPTDEELINYYLKNKILGKTSLVEEEISELNIYSKEPMVLPSLAKIRSGDHVWYFFSPKEYTSSDKKVTKRTTGFGYWKVTGVDRKIRDKRGNGVEIGIKKTLVYYEREVSKGVRPLWVMHEYHITSLPPNHKSTFVVCQVMYKGDDVGDVSYGNHLSESSHITCLPPNHKVELSVQEDGLDMKDLLIPMEDKGDRSPWDVLDSNTLFSHSNFPNVQQQSLYCDDYWNGLLGFNGGDFENVFRMQENRNDYRPKKPLSGIIVDYRSDSDGDAESISAMSPVDSVGSSHSHFTSSTDKDLQTSGDSSIGRKNKNTRCTIQSM